MSSFKLVKGSAVEQDVDAIVNAANKYLLAGSGVCGAIFNKAGYDELTDACSRICIPLKDGEAVITPSFNIKNAKYIIHAVGPNFAITPNAFKELKDAYYNSLVVLKDNNLHSISFPLISSGIYGGNLSNPVEESTKECINAYNEFIKMYNNYDIYVKLCAYSDLEMKEAQKVLKR